MSKRATLPQVSDGEAGKLDPLLLSARLQEADKRLAEAVSTRDKLLVEVNALRGSIDAIGKEKTDLLTTNASLKAQIERLQGAIAQANEANARFATLRTEKEDLALQLSAADAARLKIEQEAAAILQREIASRDARIAELLAKNQEYQKGLGAQTTISRFVAQAGEELAQAQRSLADAELPFNLTEISMDLKILPTADGSSFLFKRPEELPSGDEKGLSTLRLSFGREWQIPIINPSLVSLPSVVGATELFARRKMEEVGCTLLVRYQAERRKPGEASVEGRVLQQEPAPGSRVATGTMVSCVVGREID